MIHTNSLFAVFMRRALFLLLSGPVILITAARPATAQPFAYVAKDVARAVSVVDIGTYTVVATVGVGRFPVGIAITPDGAFVYVANSFSDDVSVVATATNTVVATVPVGDHPQNIAVTPDGAFAYVTNDVPSGTVSVIATATNTVVATVPVGERPLDIAVTPDGAFLLTRLET